MEESTWGLGREAPENATAVWGARAIFNRGGLIDIVPDRQGIDRGAPPERKRLIAALRAADKAIRAKARALSQTGDLEPDTRNRVVLYEDAGLIVIANTNASYGYLYMGAWLKPEIATEAACSL